MACSVAGSTIVKTPLAFFLVSAIASTDSRFWAPLKADQLSQVTVLIVLQCRGGYLCPVPGRCLFNSFKGPFHLYYEAAEEREKGSVLFY